MTYKGYKIKFDLKNHTLRFFNEIDDNVLKVKNKKLTLKQIENLAFKEINKRLKYLIN